MTVGDVAAYRSYITALHRVISFLYGFLACRVMDPRRPACRFKPLK